MRTDTSILALAAALAGGLALAPFALGGTDTAASVIGTQGFEQVQLTETTAKGAIDSYLEIKAKYGEEALPRATPAVAAKGIEVKKEVSDIIGSHGFASVADWNSAVVSVTLAYRVVRGGNTESIDKSLARIEEKTELSDAVKEHLRTLVESARPSAANVELVTALAKDAEYGPKLKQMRK